MSGQIWHPEEVVYLQHLERCCVDLHVVYDVEYHRVRTLQMRYRLPAICFGAVNGVASFGAGTFPPSFQPWVPVMVGGVAIVIAITQTVETFLRISETMGGSLAASVAFRKLSTDIGFELSLPLCDRATTGVIFARDAYTRYQQIMSQRPPLESMTPMPTRPILESNSALSTPVSTPVSTSVSTPEMTNPCNTPRNSSRNFLHNSLLFVVPPPPAMVSSPVSSLVSSRSDSPSVHSTLVEPGGGASFAEDETEPPGT